MIKIKVEYSICWLKNIGFYIIFMIGPLYAIMMVWEFR